MDAKFIDKETGNYVLTFDELEKVYSKTHVPKFRRRDHHTEPEEALEDEEQLLAYLDRKDRGDRMHRYYLICRRRI